MRLLIILPVVFTLLVSACAAVRRVEPPSDVRGVILETYSGPFCGRCDGTKITVANDGRVWIEQRHWADDYRNWRVTRREVEISAEALSRFRARIDGYRPHGELILAGQPPCTDFETDNSGLHIVWRDERGEDRLDYNFGCDQEARRGMAQALKTAPSLLQIAGLRVRELEW